MKHFIMIRSSYWKEPLSASRLAITKAITVPSLAAQTCKDFSLIVRVNKDDPYLDERVAAFESVGVPVLLVYSPLASNGKGPANDGAYLGGEWNSVIGRGEVVLQTRMDDDDALAVDFVKGLHEVGGSKRTVLIYPMGYVATGGKVSLRKYNSNQFPTLRTPPGDTTSVYDMTHNELASKLPVVRVSTEPMWLWVRHVDAVSVINGKQYAFDKPVALSAGLRRAFPIDWSLVDRMSQDRVQ